MTRDNPIADSDAPTDGTKRINESPITSSRYVEKNTRLKFTADNITSKDMIVRIIFFLLGKTPKIPKMNGKKELTRWKIIT
jgi:hypothetical protein